MYKIINGESSTILKTYPDNHFDSIVTDPPSDYYVYFYLREDNTPYYVGKGKGYRDNSEQHTIKPPKDKSRIVRPFDKITEEKALSMEIWFIWKYGRIDLGTGILRNKTDGGDGVSGYKYSKEQNKANSERQKGKKRGPSPLRGRTTKRKGIKQENTPEQRENHRKAMEKRREKPTWNKGLDSTDPRIIKMKETKKKNPQIPWNKGLKGSTG